MNKLKVTLNPTAPKDELPFVFFRPGNGWSIQSANIKGCHTMDLAAAVADYNRGVERAINRLNVGNVEPITADVMDLPGWGDAVREEMVSRYADKEPEASTRGKRGPGKTLGALGALLPMLAMAAAMGALDDDAEDAGLEGPPSEEMGKLLAASTVLHACPGGHAVLAVPRTLGDQWTRQLVDAIKADNVSAVRTMLETAGLMR